MAKKQWVNLVGGDPAKGEGRSVTLKLEATETKPGASEDQTAYAFIKPGGKNEPLKSLAGGSRAAAFHTEPPHRIGGTIKGKKVELVADISVAGGDTFEFEYGMKDDGSGKKKYPGDPLEVWRKVMVRVGYMKGCSCGKPTKLNGKLAKVFIEIEQDGGAIKIPHRPVVTNPSDPVSVMDHGAPSLKHPDQTVKIVYVDRNITPGQKDIDLTYKRSQLPGKKFNIRHVVRQLTWPFDDWLIGGKILLFDASGNLRADQPVHSYVARAKDGRYHKHPEGLATDTLKFDLSTYPGIDDWMKDKDAKIVITVFFKVIEFVAGGSANPTSPEVIVSTRNGFDYKKQKNQYVILLHELGHILGNALRYISVYDEKTGALDSKDENHWWYEAHGGQGNHCHSGSSPDGSTYKAGGSACVMFHATTNMNLDFCDQCQRIIKRAPLTKLGRLNVWGEAGWKP